MKLSVWRKERKLSLAKFARLASSTAISLSRIERGEQRPSPELAKRIEAATNGEVTAASLLGLDEAPRARTLREESAPFEATPRISIPVPADLLELAREHGLDVETIVADRGLNGLREAAKAAFAEANRNGVEWTRDYIARYGTLSEQLGLV